MPLPQEADTQSLSSGVPQGTAGLWVAPAPLCWLYGIGRVAQNGRSGAFQAVTPRHPIWVYEVFEDSV